MAEQWITKSKKVNGETVETKFRIDAEFIPKKTNDICMEFIMNYCEANNETDWLLEEVNTTSYTVERKDKATGKTFTKVVECNNYPFVSLRRDFITKFFPQLINQSAKRETWKEILNKKYGR